MANKKSKFKNLIHSLKQSKLFSLFVLIFLAITTVVIANKIQDYQSLSSSAASGEATVFLKTSNPNLPSDSPIQLWITADKDIAFYELNLNYNTQEVILTSLPDTSSSPLSRLIQMSSLEEANQSGTLTLIFGLDPSEIANATTGFKIADLYFDPVTSKTITTELTFSEPETQLVSLDTLPFYVTHEPLFLTLNPAESPSPEPSPAPTDEPVIDSCSSCFKGVCDNSCNQRKEDSSCPDCAAIDVNECSSCFKNICDGSCNPRKDGISCPDCL